LLVDNARALVSDANPNHFHWNPPQFLELCATILSKLGISSRRQVAGWVARQFAD
jgi:hypothetical protein